MMMMMMMMMSNDTAGEAEWPACYCWHGICWPWTHCYLQWRKRNSVM